MLARSTAATLFTLLLSSIVPIAAADQFVGIGVHIKADDQGILVQKVIPGGPAEAAGVRDGDRIVEVDGKATAGITVPQFVEHARGLEGTKLNLLIERDGARQNLIVTRGVVQIEMVKRRMLDETVGLIELVGMEPNTDREVAEALDELTGKGVKAMVLDLRSNTNGSVDMVRNIVALFIPASRPMWRVETGGKVHDPQLTGAGVK